MRRDALLLIGPTGAGKSPLGDTLEAHGFRGRRCRHFDFGARLRRAVETDGILDPGECKLLLDLFRTGGLLEDRDFPVAGKILSDFWAGASDGDLTVLNGLPRHEGQARSLDPRVRVETIIHLSCPPEILLERIRTNAGGDRTGRTDDTLEDIRRKLKVYESRTIPLLRFYDAQVVKVEVGPRDDAKALRAKLMDV